MRKFIVLVTGQLISSIGSGLTEFGLAIYVLALTGSITATAVVSICAFLPSIVLAPVGGVLADRYDRRVMMIVGEAMSGLGLVLCLVAVMSEEPSLALICAGVGVSSLFTALKDPAFKATVTDLLAEDDFAKAGGMIQIAGNAKLLISPVIAGLLLQVTHVGTLLLIDILTFFTTTITIAAVKKGMMAKHEGGASRDLRSELKEGMAILRSNAGIQVLIMIMTFVVFCLGFLQILIKPLVLAFAGETELGLLTTISAIGMLAGSLLISIRKTIRSHVRMLTIGLFGCGIFFASMGVKENVFLITVFGFIMFAFMPAAHIGAEVLIRKNLANEVQGRAFGLISFITQMGYIAAYLMSGLLADYVAEPFLSGDRFAATAVGVVIGTGEGRGSALLIILAGMLLAATGILASRLKSVRALEKLEGRSGLCISD